MPKLKRIGKGCYTTAYMLLKPNGSNSNKVYLKSTCLAKEAMALGWYPFGDSKLFPEVKVSDKPGFEYMMEYYAPVKSLKQALTPKEWEKYQELRELQADFDYREYKSTTPAEYWLNEFKRIKNKSIRSTLMAAIQTLRNYGDDVNFEISPRNVRVRNGKLILLDCFVVALYKLRLTN